MFQVSSVSGAHNAGAPDARNTFAAIGVTVDVMLKTLRPHHLSYRLPYPEQQKKKTENISVVQY